MAILKPSSLQSAHWYTREGKALHTVPNADGDGTRPTTLADARKLGLYPSVSAILQVLDKPGLNKWKQEQVALASMRIKRDKKEDDKYFMERIIAESRNEVNAASDHGIGVHGEMERYWNSRLNNTDFAPNATTFSYCKPAIEWIESKKIIPVANEVVLVNYEEGFGGTSDLPFKIINPDVIGTMDYKTKKTKPGEPIEPFDDQATQIAAYSKTYWKDQFRRCWGINVYLSSTEVGRTEAASYSPAHLAAEWEIFVMLAKIWRARNKYDPRSHGKDSQTLFFSPKMTVISGPGGVVVTPKVSNPEPSTPALPPLPIVPAVSTPPLPPLPLLPVEGASDHAGVNCPPPFPPLPPQHTNFPATGPTMLDLVNQAECNNVSDNIKFLSPTDCCEMGVNHKTDYAWWYHAELKQAKVGLKGDAMLGINGWKNAFPAYPLDIADVERTENKGKLAPIKPSKDELQLNMKEKMKAETAALKKKREDVKGQTVHPEIEKLAKPDHVSPPPATKETKAAALARHKAQVKRAQEIENLPITFGKFKGHAKIKRVGDLPETYLDYLRDVKNVPAEIAEYLSFEHVINRIDKAIA